MTGNCNKYSSSVIITTEIHISQEMEIGEEEAIFENICKISPVQHHHLQTCSAAFLHELLSVDDVGAVESTAPPVGTPVDPVGIIMPETQNDNGSTSQTLGRTKDHVADRLDVGEEESTSPTYGTPVESVGIIMLSLPETQIDNESTSQQDLFLTPPEDLLKDCDVGFTQYESIGRSPDRTKDHVADRVDASEALSIDDNCLEGEKVVDLGKDCDLVVSQSQTLGRSQNRSKDPIADCVDVGETLSVDDLEGEKVVDLGKDCDLVFSHLGRSQNRSKDPIADCVDVGEALSIDDLEGEKVVDLGEDSNSGSSIGMLSQIITAIEFQETDAGEKNVELEKSSTGKEDEVEVIIVEDSLSEVVELISGNDPTEAVESKLKVDTATNSDVNDNPSCSGVKCDKRKRKKRSTGVNLPKKGGEIPDNLKEGKIPPDFLMNVMISIADKFIAENSVPKDHNGEDDKCGMLEVAMMRGVKFPRPSWWPPDYRPSWWPEGYEGC